MDFNQIFHRCYYAEKHFCDSSYFNFFKSKKAGTAVAQAKPVPAFKLSSVTAPL
jgi:hypothetical protein